MYQNFFKKLKKKYLHENVNYVVMITNNQDLFPDNIKRKEMSWVMDTLHDLFVKLDAHCKSKSKLVDYKLIRWPISNNVDVDDINSDMESFIAKNFKVGGRITKFNIRGKEHRLHFQLSGISDEKIFRGTKHKYYISIEYDRNSVSMSVEKE